MAKSVKVYHPRLKRTATVPSKRVARVMASKGWQVVEADKAAPVKATKATAVKEQGNG